MTIDIDALEKLALAATSAFAVTLPWTREHCQEVGRLVVGVAKSLPEFIAELRRLRRYERAVVDAMDYSNVAARQVGGVTWVTVDEIRTAIKRRMEEP